MKWGTHTHGFPGIGWGGGGGGGVGGGNINRDSGEHGVFFKPYHILMYTYTSDSVIWKKTCLHTVV
jgi:hypothetical protein